MAEPATAESTTRTPDAPAERGTLDVRNRALQHLVERVALDVPGVVRRSAALGGLGSGSPNADVRAQGDTARVVLSVDAAWPANVTELGERVRDRVLTEGTRLSGVRITSVDVTVHAVTETDERRRVQ